jgi:hypothetical protein
VVDLLGDPESEQPTDLLETTEARRKDARPALVSTAAENEADVAVENEATLLSCV